MLEKTFLESTVFCNFSRIYHQLNSLNTVDRNKTNPEAEFQTHQESNFARDIMTSTLKFKAIFYSIFQAPSPMLIQKSVRHLDTYQAENEYRLKREKNNESVRKSRAKNRVKLQECSSNVKNLKIENVQLNKKLESLQSELYTLKNLFQHCFSFDLNNLPFKPSDIPTTTLYKIIMNQNKTQGASVQAQMPLEKKSEVATTSKMNDVDNHYITQIKAALASLVKPDVNMSSVEKWH